MEGRARQCRLIAALSNPAACNCLALATPRCLPATFAITLSSIRVHNTGFDGVEHSIRKLGSPGDPNFHLALHDVTNGVLCRQSSQCDDHAPRGREVRQQTVDVRLRRWPLPHEIETPSATCRYAVVAGTNFDVLRGHLERVEVMQ